MNGVDSEIIARAEALGILIARGEDLVAVCAGISVEEDEDLQSAVCSPRVRLENYHFLMRSRRNCRGISCLKICDSSVHKIQIRAIYLND